MSTDYDYIIAGGGAAGRSLAYRLLQHPILKNRRILILDAAAKDQNDRTWCFWERGSGPFESIVQHQWSNLRVFQGAEFDKQLPIHRASFAYKMIRGIDFYKHTDQAFEAAPNIDYRREWVRSIEDSASGVTVRTDQGTYQAQYCFSSILRDTIDKSGVNYLDQHFRGWFIRTESDVFNPDEAIFMDFRTPQEGEARFFYVLPTSRREALVEIAIFSNNHLTISGYDRLIANYLTAHWPQIGTYEVLDTEMGNIPMTDYKFRRQRGNTIFIGTAGGDTRGSSGYTFYNIQRTVTSIIDLLAAGKAPVPVPTLQQRRHQLYDSVLLKVLVSNYYPADALFRMLFAGNPAKRLLPFLNAESSFGQELRLMQTVPIPVFLRAFFNQFVLPTSDKPTVQTRTVERLQSVVER